MFLRTIVCRISPPIVVFQLYVGTGTKSQIGFFVKKTDMTGSLIHRWKEENEIFPESYFLPRETDCNMAKWSLMCQIACIFLKMIRSFGAPGLMIEIRPPTTQNFWGI